MLHSLIQFGKILHIAYDDDDDDDGIDSLS